MSDFNLKRTREALARHEQYETQEWELPVLDAARSWLAFQKQAEEIQVCIPHWNIVWIGPWGPSMPSHCTAGDFVEGAGTWDCKIVSKLLGPIAP